jgi:aspartyl-tRNA(Asn)/glutamyl-tRNA(Gln) amidotransferase subunit C
LTFGIFYAAFNGNMTLEHIDIDHIAKLCRLALTDGEQKTLPGQLDTMLAYVQQLKEVDVEGVEPTLHPFEESNVLRTDDPGESFSVETALSNAPEQKDNQIVVPRIVE